MNEVEKVGPVSTVLLVVYRYSSWWAVVHKGGRHTAVFQTNFAGKLSCPLVLFDIEVCDSEGVGSIE